MGDLEIQSSVWIMKLHGSASRFMDMMGKKSTMLELTLDPKHMAE